MWKIAEADLNVERTRENGFFLLAIFLVAYLEGRLMRGCEQNYLNSLVSG